MKSNYIYYLLAFTLIFQSCSDDEIFEEPSENYTFGIRHDKTLSAYEALAAANDANKPDFSSTVFFSYSVNGSANHDYAASGVLIDSEWILTAGHNFYVADEQSTPAPPSGIQVRVGNNPNIPDASYGVAQVIYHPTWLAGQQEFSDANDLCLVKLASPITNITPAPLFSSSNEKVGKDVWHCGFGAYSDRPGQNPDLHSKKHAIHNVLDRVKTGFQTTTASVTFNGGLLAFDFDNPSGTINSLGDNIINADEAILGSGTSTAGALDFEGTTVTGDSGGPLFLQDNGVWKVAGILSGGATAPITNHTDSSYGDISIYTQVSSAYDWINSVIK